MKVEIWSDVMCPYCYIGKKVFENAISRFSHAGKIDVVWKSYILDPSIPTGGKQDRYQYMLDVEGVTREEVIASQQELGEQAKSVGITYNFDSIVFSNTRDAHRLIHLANKYNQGSMAEDLLFKAFFTDGLDVSDKNVLLNIGKKLGLDETEVSSVLDSDMYEEDVRADIQEAERLGLEFIPYFWFDRKSVVTGVVTEDDFVRVLEKAFGNTSGDDSDPDMIQGRSCSLDGTCS